MYIASGARLSLTGALLAVSESWGRWVAKPSWSTTTQRLSAQTMTWAIDSTLRRFLLRYVLVYCNIIRININYAREFSHWNSCNLFYCFYLHKIVNTNKFSTGLYVYSKVVFVAIYSRWIRVWDAAPSPWVAWLRHITCACAYASHRWLYMSLEDNLSINV